MSFDQTLAPTKKSAPRKPGPKTASAQRPRILGEEEKRQLILAHAASRQPVDHVQRISLVAGVFICVAVIGIGWLYSVRKSVAQIYPAAQSAADRVGQTKEEAAWQQYLLKQEIHNNTDSIIKRVEDIEAQQLGGGLGKLMEDSMKLVSTTAMMLASSTEDGVSSVSEQLRTAKATTTQAKTYALPPGVTQDR